MNVRLYIVERALRTPWVSSTGSLSRRRLLVLALQDSAGRMGFGEAAPLAAYDGVEISHVREALEDCRKLLAESDGTDREALLAACANAAVLPQAVAAVDLALWDLAGRRAGVPVWRLLPGAGGPGLPAPPGAPEPRPVTVNATIAAEDRLSAATAAARLRDQGYRTIKVKVAIGDDSGRLAAIRAAAGPAVAIRIDANGAWTVKEAHEAMRLLAPIGIELAEEPTSGVHQIEDVSSSSEIPISLDESAIAPGAFDRRVCDAVCLKISRCGGITGVLDAARRARMVGYEVYLASTLDGPLGISAALHAAVAIAPDRPNGLATLGEFAPRENPLPAVAGAIAVPAGPGLGDDLRRWYEFD